MENVGKYTGLTTIEKFYTDINGNLLPVFLADLLSEISGRHSTLTGTGIEKLMAMGQTWMLHRLHVRIPRLPRKEEEIRYETWCSEYSTLFALRDYVLKDREGTLLVDGTSEWMMIDLGRRRPIRLCSNVIEGCRKSTVRHLSIPSVLNAGSIPDNLSEYRPFNASYSNIDFNGHVTQASYLRWITDALPFTFQKKHVLNEFEIIYEHEILPDSEIISTYEMMDKETAEDSPRITVLHKLVSYHGDIVHCTAKTLWTRIEK